MTLTRDEILAAIADGVREGMRVVEKPRPTFDDQLELSLRATAQCEPLAAALRWECMLSAERFLHGLEHDARDAVCGTARWVLLEREAALKAAQPKPPDALPEYAPVTLTFDECTRRCDMEADTITAVGVTDIVAKETRYQLFRLFDNAARFATTLRRFRLQGAQRNDGALYNLPSATADFCRVCTRLERLEMPFSNVLANDHVFLKVIPFATSLLLLDVSGTVVSDSGVCLALTSCPKLLVLNIKFALKLTPKTGDALCAPGLPLRRLIVDLTSRIGVARVRDAKKDVLTVEVSS